jgi:hypothetical protein
MIHYFLEGEPGYTYFESWQKHASDFKKWDASNLPYDQYPILEKFRDTKKWSILSDFVRRWAVLEFGGIYLDWDVELIKPIDRFYAYESFVCIEGPPAFGNMAVSGGKAGNKHHRRLLEIYLDTIEGKRNYGVQVDVACGPWCATDYLVELKGSPLEELDMFIMNDFDGLTTIPKACFYPYNWNEQYDPSCIKDNTYGIHWWKKGWA